MATGTQAFVWRNAMVCVATYVILESDALMDQFEERAVPFRNAGPLQIRTLRYFPRLQLDSQQMSGLSIEVARTFLKHLAKNYTATKESRSLNSATIIREVAAVFADGAKTLTDVAAAVDKNFKFADE